MKELSKRVSRQPRSYLTVSPPEWDYIIYIDSLLFIIVAAEELTLFLMLRRSVSAPLIRYLSKQYEEVKCSFKPCPYFWICSFHRLCLFSRASIWNKKLQEYSKFMICISTPSRRKKIGWDRSCFFQSCLPLESEPCFVSQSPLAMSLSSKYR